MKLLKVNLFKEMFKRLKRIIKLSKKDPEYLDKLTEEDLVNIPEIGDGKALFFDEGSTEEFEDLQRKDKFGFKKLFNIK